jgi:hypothetical protein
VITPAAGSTTSGGANGNFLDTVAVAGVVASAAAVVEPAGTSPAAAGTGRLSPVAAAVVVVDGDVVSGAAELGGSAHIHATATTSASSVRFGRHTSMRAIVMGCALAVENNVLSYC